MVQKIGFFFVNAALLCTWTLQAQFGVKGSFNLSGFHSDEHPVGSETRRIPGLSGGLVGTMPLSEILALRAELLYAQKGHKYEVVLADGAYVKTRLGYIELPLLLQIAVPASASVKPLVLAGGYGAYLLSARMSGQYEAYVDVRESFKKTDFGLIIGAGLHLAVGTSGSVLVDFRYCFGLTDIYDVPEAAVSMKNRGLSFSMGYLF